MICLSDFESLLVVLIYPVRCIFVLLLLPLSLPRQHDYIALAQLKGFCVCVCQTLCQSSRQASKLSSSGPTGFSYIHLLRLPFNGFNLFTCPCTCVCLCVLV